MVKIRFIQFVWERQIKDPFVHLNISWGAALRRDYEGIGILFNIITKGEENVSVHETNRNKWKVNGQTTNKK